MDEIYINWLAIMLAGLFSMVIGSIWYAKPVYGKLWIKMAKVDEKKMQKNGIWPFVIAVAMSLLAAYVIAHVSALANAFYDAGALSAALSTALWLCAGLSLTTVVVHNVFENRPWKLTFVTAGYQFFLLMAQGLIIGLFGGF